MGRGRGWGCSGNGETDDRKCRAETWSVNATQGHVLRSRVLCGSRFASACWWLEKVGVRSVGDCRLLWAWGCLSLGAGRTIPRAREYRARSRTVGADNPPPVSDPTFEVESSMSTARAHGVVVSHPLRMRKALGSNPSVSRSHDPLRFARAASWEWQGRLHDASPKSSNIARGRLHLQVGQMAS